MESVQKVFKALPAPYYALSLTAPKSYRPEGYHVGVWFLIAIALSLILIISDSMGWSWAEELGRLAGMAWLATLLCRLALVEHEITEIKTFLAKK